MGTFIAIANSILTTLSRGIRVFSGLLDEYGGAAAAYSVRRLSSDYATPTDSEFSFGGALEFDGVNDYVNINTPFTLSEGTIAFWFMPLQTNYNRVIGADGSSNFSYINPQIGFSKVLLRINNAANQMFFTDPLPMTIGNWYHIAVTFNSTTANCFVNGIACAENPFTIPVPSSTFQVFNLGRLWQTTTYGKQILDEVAVWNTVLSATDIANLYNEIDGVGQGDFATNYSPANLQAYWRANDGSGTTLTDEQGTYNGTLANFDTNVCWVDGKANKGALVEIRRSSDDLVKNFYYDSNNELSLNSKDWNGTTLSSWIGSDDGFVSTWYDQSGNASNAIQTIPSYQPQIVNSGTYLGYLQTLAVFGNMISSYSYIVSQEYSSFSVFENSGNCVIGGTNSGNSYYGLGQSGSALSSISGFISPSFYRNGSVIGTTRNDVFVESSSFSQFSLLITANSSNTLAIGYTGAAFNNNRFKEFVLYPNQTLSRTGVENNQMTYYSISPPSGIGTWAIGTTFVIQ